VAGVSPSHYERISALHLSGSGIDSNGLKALTTLLAMPSCALQSLDLSNTTVDGALLAKALKANSSLASLDVRGVPKMAESYEALGAMLFEPAKVSHLAFLRCDLFELVEGEAALSLRERRLDVGGMTLLMGLLTNNTTLVDLDLGATNLQKEWTPLLMELFKVNSTLMAVHLIYNPAIGPSEQADLLAAAKEGGLDIALHF